MKESTTTLFIRIAFSILTLFFWGIIAYMIEPGSGALRYTVDTITTVELFESHFLYLGLNLVTFSFPFFLSFDKRVSFYKEWKYLLPAIILTAIVFLLWDVYYTATGIWGFNPEYYLEDTVFFGLPLSEFLFFFTVPYACLFIFKCFEYYFPSDPFKSSIFMVLVGLIILFFTLGIMNLDRAYTGSAFILASSLTGIALFSPYRKKMGLFLKAFLICLIPFLLVNGILTGGFTNNPVVVYNDLENLGYRLGSIPVDDIVYCYGLLLLNALIYWSFKRWEI